MSSFLKRRKSDNVEPDDSENGTSIYRNNSSSTSICDLPVFVSEGNDSVSPSTSQSSPFLPRRMPQTVYRKRSYSRTDEPLLPTLFKATLKYASRGFFFYLACISMYRYDEVILWVRETASTRTLKFPPWLKFQGSLTSKLHAFRLENERLTMDVENLHADLTRATTLSTQLSQENERYKHALALLEEENEGLANEQQLVDLREQTERLKGEIQKMSRHEVFHRYGKEPHRVEFQVQFPPGSPSSPDGSNPTKFIVELAPLELMPHAVYTFLQTVDNGLWNDVSIGEDLQNKPTSSAEFRQIARHIVVAQPRKDTLEDFLNNFGIPTMSFAEFNERYDHEKYTLGYIATHPGPSFYISLVENKESHAGDPCFGKIISGFETVDRISASPRNGQVLDPPVKIVGVSWA